MQPVALADCVRLIAPWTVCSYSGTIRSASECVKILVNPDGMDRSVISDYNQPILTSKFLQLAAKELQDEFSNGEETNHTDE